MDHPEPESEAGVFELSGGELCLDFANSWGNRGDRSTDRLSSYGRLLRFALEAGQLSEREFERLAADAEREPAAAAAAWGRAVQLREALFELFDARARAVELPQSALEILNAWLAEALPWRRLSEGDGQLEWTWRRPGDRDWLAPLYPCVDSAARLVTSEDLGRVRVCDAEDCSWLFLDRSRSRSRRWCSMDSCGNRAKARRHYRRHRGN